MANPPFNSGPVPPFNNPPIQPQNFQPSEFVISGVLLGTTTTVTTVLSNNYVIGQIVRLLIPESFGCSQLNEQTGIVISIPAANQVILNIDSSKNVDAFKSSSATTKAQIVPVGDINSGNVNSNGRVNLNINIPGSFINVSH